MRKRFIKVGVAVLAVFAAMGTAFVMAMRSKYPPLQRAVRRFNRDVVNPEQMDTAGQPGAYASIIHHIGRKSGRHYETPVQARPAGEGFIIPLPYGDSADWLKNVMKSGSATLITEGSTYTVDHPEIIGSDAAEPFIRPDGLKAQRLFGVDHYLQLRRAVPEDAEQATVGAV